MNPLETYTITCPYCWQEIEITVDCSAGAQRYSEDCSVCCRPLLLTILQDESENYRVEVSAENE
ncbi:CPXCG motif-containing cysteine-rich protein [Mariprofundus micogutta]|uniref:CPXCG motif-containing cysteine-rich protein n=1 Tax=Mariprofundus micogutta TaxID=1921010 RepID=UPI000932597E